MEDIIRKKWMQTPYSVVDEWVGKLIPNLGHSKGRDSKHVKIINLYRDVKEIMASNLGRQENNTILEKLDQMEENYDAFITTILTSNEEGSG